MAKKTGFEDLFGDDFGKLGIERLEQLNAIAKELKSNLKSAASEMQSNVKGTQFKGGDDVEKFKKQKAEAKLIIDQLNAAEKAELATQQKLAQLRTENAAATAAYNKEIKDQNQLLKENAILESKTATQYEKNIVLLNRLSKEIKGLGGLDKAPKALADQFSKVRAEVDHAEQSVKEFQRNVGNYSSATAELKDLTRQLIDLERAGQRDSAAFREMQQKAAELKDTIGDVKAEIKAMASDTRTIDGMVGAVNLLANGFQVLEGVSALVGDNSEEWKETMIKLQAVMAVTSGLQEVQNLLQKESAAMMFINTVQTKAAAAAQTLYSFATGGATVATKAFRIALLATGIGAIVVLLGTLAGAMGSVGDETEDETDKQLKLNDAMNEYTAALKKQLEIRKAQSQGARGSAEDMQRELNKMRARGDSAQKIFNQEQAIRKEEARAMKEQIDIKSASLGSQYNLTKEFYDDYEALRNKNNEIEVATLEHERERREEAANNKKEGNKKEVESVKEANAEIINNEEETQRTIDEIAEAEMEANKAAYEESLKDLQEFQAEEDRLRLEQEQKEKDSLERRKNAAIAAAKALSEFTKSQLDEKLSAIDSELSASEKREDDLKQLAQQGSLNAQQSIALEQERQAKLENDREKAIKKQREQAIILAGIEAFISSARAGSQNPSGDSGAQVSSLLDNLKGAVTKIKGFETGGKVEGGEQMIRINEAGEEFVVKAGAVSKYGDEMLYDINEGRFNPLDYISTPSMNSMAFTQSSTAIVNELRDLKEELRNKPVPSWNVSPITKGIVEDVRVGNTLLSKHYQRANKLF